MLQGMSSGGAQEWRAALDEVWAIREEYYESVRDSIGASTDPAR